MLDYIKRLFKEPAVTDDVGFENEYRNHDYFPNLSRHKYSIPYGEWNHTREYLSSFTCAVSLNGKYEITKINSEFDPSTDEVGLLCKID